MLRVECSGNPYEIGVKHGREAKALISRTIDFYVWQFKENCKLDWNQVQGLADEFEPIMRRKWPAYLEEIRGVADGSERSLSDIIAINVRTEITFGMFNDGCTSLSWKTSQSSWLGQNWDWDNRQKENLIQLTISQPDKPTIKMMTEAGLIGKIGFNSAGVGVCLNAIKAKGMDPTRLPCHLGLRMVLESFTRDEAVQKLEKYGIGSACHMLIADATGGVGLEWSAYGVEKVRMNGVQQVFHSNHYLLDHKGVEDTNWLKDSTFRVQRIEQLCHGIDGTVDGTKLLRVFQDESNAPSSICRSQNSQSGIATLFNIIMDLQDKKARVTLGRPIEADEVIDLAF